MDEHLKVMAEQFASECRNSSNKMYYAYNNPNCLNRPPCVWGGASCPFQKRMDSMSGFSCSDVTSKDWLDFLTKDGLRKFFLED